MRRAVRLCGAFGLALCTSLVADAARSAEALEPYQLVRSLQLIQDRIAAGDHAALPMQGKLLEMIDARLRTANADDLKDPRNFRALLVYGMSGGNPVTVRSASSRTEPDARDRVIANGIIDYLGGRPAAAIETLKPIDPMALPDDLAAFVALVKGSLLAAQDPAQALALLDDARLLSPGTLVEEAALRRSVGIAAATGDAERFTRASRQYVERYLYSPYASQFADSFVSGVIALHLGISHEKLLDITSMMDTERERTIYLRIARNAAIDGFTDLSAFASEKAGKGSKGDQADDPRSQLYASLAAVTSATVPDLRETLKSIDRSQLSDSDRRLLDAARTVAREMTAPPPALVSRTPEPAPVVTTQPAAPPKAIVDDTGLPPLEGALPEEPAASVPNALAKVEKVPVAVAPAKPQTVADATAPADPTAVVIADTRRKLDMIDQLLGASPE